MGCIQGLQLPCKWFAVGCVYFPSRAYFGTLVHGRCGVSKHLYIYTFFRGGLHQKTSILRWPWRDHDQTSELTSSIILLGCVCRFGTRRSSALYILLAPRPPSRVSAVDFHCCALRSCGLLTLITQLSAVKLRALALTWTSVWHIPPT